jgi:hypothetical protein
MQTLEDGNFTRVRPVTLVARPQAKPFDPDVQIFPQGNSGLPTSSA